MGWFSSNDDHHGWKKEFDEKLAKGVDVDRGMRGNPRVKDRNGNYFTRDGKSCCGCGKDRNFDGYDADNNTMHDRRGNSGPNSNRSGRS